MPSLIVSGVCTSQDWDNVCVSSGFGEAFQKNRIFQEIANIFYLFAILVCFCNALCNAHHCRMNVSFLDLPVVE